MGSPYRTPVLSAETEHKYRSIIAELSSMLAAEKLPGASGSTVVSAAIQIATGMYERFHLPPVPVEAALQSGTDRKDGNGC